MKKIIVSIFLLVFGFFFFSTSVEAKILTQPELRIYIDNNVFPIEEYYLDILVEYDGEVTRKNSADPMLDVLFQYEDEDGLYGLLSYQYGAEGSFQGEMDRNRILHYFRGDLPTSFKIIVVGIDQSVIVSDWITPKDYPSIETYSTVLYFDMTENRVSVFDIHLNIFAHVLIALVLLLVAKGFVLMIFGYDLFENLKVFIVTNIVLLFLLNIFVTIGLYYYGFTVAFYSLLFLSFVILIIEGSIYAFKLTGGSRAKNVLIALVGNVVSIILSLLFMIIA